MTARKRAREPWEPLPCTAAQRRLLDRTLGPGSAPAYRADRRAGVPHIEVDERIGGATLTTRRALDEARHRAAVAYAYVTRWTHGDRDGTPEAAAGRLHEAAAAADALAGKLLDLAELATMRAADRQADEDTAAYVAACAERAGEQEEARP